MSSQITTALVQGYQDNIEIKFQQMQTRLRSAVTVETQNSEFDYYDRITSTSMQEETTRHDDTPLIDTPHDRRRVGLRRFRWADLIDDKDKVRMLADPTSPYVMNAVAAANRQTDSLIIEAFDATVYTGKTGSTTLSFSADGGQEIAVDYVESGSATDSNLTIGKLRNARKLFGEAEAEEDDLFFVGSPSQRDALLRTTEVTSSDYNTVKALVAGEINTFMGFNFIWSNLLTSVTGNIRHAFAFARQGVKLCIGADITTRVSERDDKNYSVQPYVSMQMGATRMWGEKVIRVLCDEDL